MRMIVEDADVLAVKEGSEYYGVSLTDDQAKRLIETNKSLTSELYETDSYLDRETLSGALVKWVMQDVSFPDWVRSRWGWSWPEYGDSPRYRKEFDEAFKKAAERLGVKVE